MKGTLDCERENSKVEPLKISHFLYGQEMHENVLKSYKSEVFDFNIYGLPRSEMIAESIR